MDGSVARGVFPVIRDDDDRRLRRLLLIAMAFGFAALIAAGFAAWRTTGSNLRYNRLVDHTFQAREAIAQVQVGLERSETGRRGFLLSGEPEFDSVYRHWSGALASQTSRVAALTADNPRQVRNIALLRRGLAALGRARERSMEQVRAGNFAAAYAAFQEDRSVELTRIIRARLSAMLAEESRLLAVRIGEQHRGGMMFLTILAGAGVLVMGVAALSLLTVLRYTRDLGASSEKLRMLNSSLEDRVAERTADLSRANEEIQRFAYIVSHDLRSPLVNVMGFTAELDAGRGAIAELVDRVEADAPALMTEEARLAAREDLPEAIGFIRTSTAKMDRLITAILKLSREGRRVITPVRIDMAAVTATIRDTLQHRLDESGATIAIMEPLPAIVSDRLAIEQVFGNVIENAVKYLDPARPGRIVVRGTRDDGFAVFEVEDNGRGIDPRDHQRVFDLFRRAGQQDQPGEGIGLAHVRALTHRLGGTIDIVSELGSGATFRITLPLVFSEIAGASA